MTAADPSGSRIASSGGSPDASPPPTRGQSRSTSKTGSRPTSKQAPQWQNLSSSDIDFSPRPEQTTEYWMKKPPSDFRRTKRMGHLARMASQAGLTTSKSLPTLQGSPGRGGGNSTQVNEANTVAQAEHRREEAELEALQKIADRRQREASLLEARRVKLEETLIEVRSEWARVCEDAYGKDFDAASAGETMAALQLEIDNLNAASTEFSGHEPTLQFLIRRGDRLKRQAGARCTPLQEKLAQLGLREAQTSKELGICKEQVGLLETERKELGLRRQLTRRQWEYEISTMQDELAERKADAMAINEVRRKAVDKLKAELGDGSYEDEEELRERERANTDDKTVALSSITVTKERLTSLEATYTKLSMLFGPGDPIEELTDKVIEYTKNPRKSAREKIQGAIDQGRVRHEQLTAELNRCTESLAQLKFTGESSNVGYLVLSPRTGEILAFGGSPEVNELGRKCMVARKQKQLHSRRCGESSLLLAHVTSCINGLMQQTNIAEQPGIAPSAPPDVYIHTDQTPSALDKVLQRLVKVTLAIQEVQGSKSEKMPPTAALSLIQDVLARDESAPTAQPPSASPQQSPDRRPTRNRRASNFGSTASLDMDGIGEECTMGVGVAAEKPSTRMSCGCTSLSATAPLPDSSSKASRSKSVAPTLRTLQNLSESHPVLSAGGGGGAPLTEAARASQQPSESGSFSQRPAATPAGGGGRGSASRPASSRPASRQGAAPLGPLQGDGGGAPPGGGGGAPGDDGASPIMIQLPPVQVPPNLLRRRSVDRGGGPPGLPQHRSTDDTQSEAGDAQSVKFTSFRQGASLTYTEAVRLALSQLASHSFKLDESSQLALSPLKDTNTRIALNEELHEHLDDDGDDDDGWWKRPSRSRSGGEEEGEDDDDEYSLRNRRSARESARVVGGRDGGRKSKGPGGAAASPGGKPASRGLRTASSCSGDDASWSGGATPGAEGKARRRMGKRGSVVVGASGAVRPKQEERQRAGST